MSPFQHRLLALWAALLSGVVCLVFLPVSRPVAIGLLLAMVGLIAAVCYAASRRAENDLTVSFDDLPAPGWHQPVVLLCGDLPTDWPSSYPVLTVSQGCWIHVPDAQDVLPTARQLLCLRPGWGSQLSVMVSVCPQQHASAETLTSHLLALRWHVSQLRRKTGHAVPLVLCGQVGSAIVNAPAWQVAAPEQRVSVWHDAATSGAMAGWLSPGEAIPMAQQLLMNSLNNGFSQHVSTAFTQPNPDIPSVTPAVVVCGVGPVLHGALPSSLWTAWLTRHTALRNVAGWLPADVDAPSPSLLPDFLLPLLPEGRGLTPAQRAWRVGLTLLTLAAIAALCSSGWHNRQLLQRLSFDIHHYDTIAMNKHGPKAKAVAVLRQDAAQLDDWTRNGEPVRLGLGLYQGERLRLPLLNAIRSYIPPPPPEPEITAAAPGIIRLDSMSLFNSGAPQLKDGSTRVLVNALLGIKAKPGWLVVVAGHTDNTGDAKRNQTLSLKRAEAVRDWMRDSGDIPESCFAVQGYGDRRPVATNDTPEGRALNRRVEISLVPQADACRLPGLTSPSPGEGGGSEN